MKTMEIKIVSPEKIETVKVVLKKTKQVPERRVFQFQGPLTGIKYALILVALRTFKVIK